MANTIAKLNIHVGAQTTALESGLRRAQGSVQGFAGLAARALGLLTAGAGAGFAVKLAADAEQAQVAYGTLLGSAEDAARTLAEINRFAAETPFETPELVSAGQMLAAFGWEAERIVPSLRMLGDLAAGTNQPIGELAEIFGKARVQGRLFMEDINQLTGRGIPIIQELAKQFGVAETEVRKLVESGQVNFTHLEAALQQMTGEGGKFTGLMAAQAETLAGKWSTLTDNVKLQAAALAENLVPMMKAALDGGIALTEAIGALDAGTVRTTLQVVAMAAAFGLAVKWIPKIVAGIRTVITAIRAMTTAQVIAQALSGPQGWATIAAGLVVAAGAAYAAGAAFDQMTGDLSEVEQQAKAAAEAPQQLAQAAAPAIKQTATAAEEAAKKMADLAQAGKQLTEQLRTPAEEFADRLVELDELIAAGAISWETYRRAVDQATEGLRTATEAKADFEVPAAVAIGAVTRGTTAGFSAAQAGQREQTRMAEIAEKQRQLAERQTKLLEEINQRLAEQGRPPITKVNL